MISLNILFANDDVLTQWVMSDVLKRTGFVVTSVCRGGQVVDLLGDAPEFDLLLVDATLSDSSDQCEAARQWRRALPGRPIIFTGPDRNALRQPLQSNERFLRTPFSAAALLRTIDNALEAACFRPMLPPMAPLPQHMH